jgi:hypothetical protein
MAVGRILLLVVVASAGCTPAPPARRAPAQARVAPLRPTAAAVASPQEACRIVAPEARVTVRVPLGEEALDVDVDGARVTAVPIEGGALAAKVEAALELAGRIEGVEIFPIAAVTAANGIVELGPMSVLQSTSAVGSDLVARTVDVGPGFQLSGLTVPCDKVTFVGAGHPAEEAHRGVRAPRLRSVGCDRPCPSYSTPSVLDFYERPGEGASVRLTGSTIVTELEGQGEWARVATQDSVHMDGAQLTGWVRREQLTKLDGGFGFTGGRGFAELPGKGRGRRLARGEGVYQGPAHIDQDTPVFDSPTGGVAWATIADPTATFEVITRKGEARAELVSGPSFPALQRAWVAAGAVHPR